ncbi:MAG: phenylalanine--tRNA ligase subunit beta [Bacillota bacterium]|nr:phenylalanine--tRNA ligase subunit beta [Bacillota bacterium]
MIVPYKWLKRYIEIGVPIEEYARRMIMAGTGIESITKQNDGMDDTLIEFELNANRTDCMSIIGIARESAAVLGVDWTPPKVFAHESGGNIGDIASVQVDDPALCPRYMARVVKNIKIAPSPVWMQQALKSAGVRPINNVVDVTNYVMLEMGQPLHAFDLDKVRGGKIIVRRAEEGEKLATLDGKERELDDETLLICDAQGGIAIAGVMGGGNSEVSESTKAVLIESAKFDRANNRRTARALGIATEASIRFSKGLDIAGVALALDRAAQLMQEIGAGEVVSGVIDICSAEVRNRYIQVSVESVNRLLGSNLSSKEMVSLLKRLHISTQERGGMLLCDIPTFREDIEGEADIAEEVARLYGYENIPMTLMRGDIACGMLTREQALRDKLKQTLAAMGFYECSTYSFTGEKPMDMLLIPAGHELRNMVRIKNPLGEEQQYMRTTAATGMMQVVAANINKKNKNGMFFEISNLYFPNGEDLPAEKLAACLAAYGDTGFYQMKGALEEVCRAAGTPPPRYEAGGSSWHHPGRCAIIYLDGKQAGSFGEVHPDCMKAFGIEGRAYIGEIDLGLVISLSSEEKRYTPLPRYPSLERDLALVVDRSVPVGRIQQTMEEVCGELLESVKLFDVYEGSQVEKGKKSVAFSLYFRAKDRTLTDEEANALLDKLLEELKKQHGAVLRI